TREIHDMAEKVFHITGARGVARVDFMVDEETNIPYVLEINAVPGLKRKSLMPREAKLCGIVYEDMIEDILRAAL
ncbi:MAG: D-alanine--D-alanine ligase, partial [Selenomonadaceae bacterium]|nr:D-alanine--D-alanine ligase [Selenomonadaceae bacterium]